MNSPTPNDQTSCGSSLEERKLAALEEQAEAQGRIAKALEVLATNVRFKLLAEQVGTLARRQEIGSPDPQRELLLKAHSQLREQAWEQLTGVPSPWL